MAALVAIMIMVSIGTFSWQSMADLRKHPRSSSVVMLATVVTVVTTHNLAFGVLVGVLLSGIFFCRENCADFPPYLYSQLRWSLQDLCGGGTGIFCIR